MSLWNNIVNRLLFFIMRQPVRKAQHTGEACDMCEGDARMLSATGWIECPQCKGTGLLRSVVHNRSAG